MTDKAYPMCLIILDAPSFGYKNPLIAESNERDVCSFKLPRCVQLQAAGGVLP